MSRFPLAMTAVTVGALAVSAAVLIEAFAVVDQRATQILLADPQAAPPAKKTTSANHTIRRDASQAAHGPGPNAASAAPVKAETVGSAVSPTRVPESDRLDGALDHDNKLRAHERHRRHGRSARRRSPEPGGPPQPPPATPDTSRSAFFFPFH